ncbi:MAG: SpoIID/LytB domain-containing protein [Myxococcales bacterium]|nr:SpoIID/LytB domain-containing protein [Myxococcales bacterium]
MTPLLLLALSAAPLQVRVLEREKPTKARLEAPTLTCDGKPLPKKVEVVPGNRELSVGGAKCTEVVASGGATVALKDVTRRFPGVLKVSLEGGVLRFLNEVDVEDYLPSVVTAELGDGKPAALEVQAVVSRTFALTAHRHGKAGYGLCDLSHCQVYRGADASDAAKAAVKKTKGQVVLVGGVALKPTFFHASCGGYTSRAQDVFGDEGAGPGVSDVEGGAPRCAGMPDFAWEFVIEKVKLAEGLGLKNEGHAFEPLRRDAAGRVVELRSFGRRFSGADFQSAVGRAFGWQSLRSMKVSLQEAEGLLRFSGTGLGHGVGLCQQGAKALAEKGVDARGILQRYFPDSQVRVP